MYLYKDLKSMYLVVSAKYNLSRLLHGKPVSCNENRITLCPYSHTEKPVFIAGILFLLQRLPLIPPVLPCTYVYGAHNISKILYQITAHKIC